jgi:hypothetical protein
MKFESHPGKLPQLEMKHFWNPTYSISETIVLVTAIFNTEQKHNSINE